MNVFSTAHRRRTTAFVVLLLWVFSVAAGIVNACVLDAHQAPAGRAADVAAGDAVVPSLVATHGRAILEHGDDLDGSGAPCLKVCESNSQALPKLQSVMDQGVLAQMPPPTVFWTLAAQAVLPADWVDRMPPATRVVPIRVRLVRLAL